MQLRVRPGLIMFLILFVGLVVLFIALGLPWYGAVVLAAVGLVVQWVQQNFFL